MFRRVATLITLAAIAAGCSSQSAQVSLFDTMEASTATDSCPLIRDSELSAILPTMANYLKGVKPTTESTEYENLPEGALSDSCSWITQAGPVVVYVTKAPDAALKMVENAPPYLVTFDHKVVLVSYPFSEAVVVSLSDTEVLTVSATMVVPRSDLIAAAKKISAPSGVKWPDIEVRKGPRLGIDAWRSSFSVTECGVVAQLPLLDVSKERTSFSPGPSGTGIVEIHPVTPLAAYEFATLGKAMNALKITLHDDYVQLGDYKTSKECNGVPATARAALWTNPESPEPTHTGLSLKELSDMSIEGNGWRVAIVVTADKNPTYVAPTAPPLAFTFPVELLEKP